jgi:hypothetical protein
MKTIRLLVFCALLVFIVAASSWAQPFQLTSQDGKSSLKFGLLLQPQGEWIDTTTAEHTTENLYLRRFRILLGGKLGDKVTFFVETDTPNVGKAAADGTKSEANMYVQDASITYSFTPSIMIDGGMLLLPLSHNAQQGATTLLPVDYGPYSFLASTPTTSRVGRDYGAQFRGYLFNNHLEFRAAITDGVRGASAKNPFRTTYRVVFYPFDAETGFFYTGTNFGKKRIVAIGGSYDAQKDYKTTSGDLYVDLPAGKSGDAVTLQADFTNYDGGKLIPTFAKQDATLVEASYYFHSIKVGPFLQYAKRNYDAAATPDEKYEQVGLAWWASGHNFNLKLGAGKFEKAGAKDRNQVLLQAQLYFF